MCVLIGSIDYYDSDDDFCLTQTPSKEFSETNSYSYGSGLLDKDEGIQGTLSGIVSLENNSDVPTFDLGIDLSQQSDGKKYIYDNVEIEDISSDDELDNL